MSSRYYSKYDMPSNSNIRGLLINSLGTAAYYLSKLYSGGSCVAEQLMKFDTSLQFQSYPNWQVQLTTTQCQPTGIIFGPKENLIISMNGGSTPTISLFNDTGLSYSWIWGYTITGALPTSNSVLSDLKANVATTISMIAFAIGTSTI